MNLANVITSFRIIFAVAMVLVLPFSTVFWICYLGGGLSDILDGFIARKWNHQSEAGAKFDSIADMIFAVSVAIVVIKNCTLPLWLWVSIALIALLRSISYGIGFYKYHTFPALHTYLNKATGALLFLFPLLYALLGLSLAGGILCLTALLSSLEELAITVTSKALNRDCKRISLH